MRHPIAMKMSIGYVLFGALWIPFVDRIILIFIGISAVLLYGWIRRIETPWRKSHILFKKLFESVNDAIFILQESAVVDCNQRALEMFARPKKELLGHQPWEFSAAEQPDGRNSKQKAAEKFSACTRGSSQYFEWEHIRPDDTRFYTTANLHAIELDKQTQVVAIIRDITLQKQDKEELDTYKHLVSASVDAMALVDRQYRYKAASSSYTQTWGKQPEEVIGQKVPDLLGREFFEKEVKHRTDRCLAGEEVRYQLCRTSSDGHQRFLDVIYYPHFELTKRGAITGYVVTARDITDIRQMENKLRQAYKMEAIGTLAGGIAHDFNNILMVILLNAENTLKLTKKGSEIYANLTMILEAANRAADLVNQILTFCRQDEQELYPVQIHLAIKEVAKFMRASMPATIQMLTKIESESLVLADPTQIHQVMMNLCTNASHAMKDTGGILTITLHDVDLDDHFTEVHPPLKPGRHVKLSVSDTGIGIPPEIIDRVFDPFFTTKEKGEGTGMGLSVVHGIVESCGGSISVYSEPNQGTIFHIYFPVMEIQADQDMDQPVPIPRGSETVLFVDDEVKLVESGQQILEKLGYTVVISTSGKEAYDIFSQNPDRFDLVITDLTMPYMTGDELARKIRAHRADMPILMITGFNAQATSETLESAQFDKFIMKPLTTREIATSIRNLLDDKK